MKFTLELENDYLFSSTTGTVNTLEEMQQYATAILNKTYKYGIKRILLDQTGLKNNTSSLDASLLANSVEIDMAAVQGIRVATIVTPNEYSIAVTYENALFNRSLNCKTFMEKEQAMQWLTS
ncbi:hypothetical protein SYK_26590 [Pseudodesulfovibrio nedwellii]|uniref:STAS/SEC14 domain-containing protein n=1 Tax=Pseudodesulfovibrio nedwellii TaxID=2973072 RepID=A0ABN6S4Z9_9BACT|nr:MULTISPECIES: hypothetical protein [Pseudodesulfovibrio]BDQ38299.1 hypothetical protein SYK_26590 [Pseudodesulfovibrio nedwellii]